MTISGLSLAFGMRVSLLSVDLCSWYAIPHVLRRDMYNGLRPSVKLWELLLTFDREVEYFWCRPFTWSKALFFSVSLA
jgi:hypothetical protein